MSDITADQELDSGVDSDQTAPEGTEPASVGTDESSSPLLDLDEYGNHMVLTKVDGTERRVPLSEVRDGYMKGQDYTFKTQQLAQDRQRLAQAEAIAYALEQDPQETLRILAEQFGEVQEPEEDLDLDPTQKVLRELTAWKAEQEQQSKQQAIQSELDGLAGRFGDYDQQELLVHATRFGIPNLEAAYLHLREMKSASQLEQHQTAETQRTDAKRAAAVIEGGGNRNLRASTLPHEGIHSLEDAFAAAEMEFG